MNNNIYIGPDSFWDGLGGITIEDNVIIGPKSIIWTYNHNYKGANYLPYDEIEILKEVKICKNVWIGIGVFILPGVTIGEGSIIAMGSVVTKDVDPLSIMGGNPAKLISKRDNSHYQVLVKNKKYYMNEKHSLIKKYIKN